MTEFEKAAAIRNHMIGTAAQCWSYSWSADFQAQELREAQKRCVNQVGNVDISSFTCAECRELGFGRWSEDSGLYLVPLWLFSFLAEGIELTSISGTVKTVTPEYNDTQSPNYIDNDVRMGCTAWGITPAFS